MTGYGKAEAQLSTGKLTIEIRTLNSKSCDINLKKDILPKDKELEFRSIISSSLVRGTIDVYLNWESGEAGASRQINKDIALSYLQSALNALGYDGSGKLFTSSGMKELPSCYYKDKAKAELLLSKAAECAGFSI